MTKDRSLLKAITLCTLIAFGTSSVSFGQTSSPALTSSLLEIKKIPKKIELPEELGTVQEEYRAPGDKPWIVFIQDAHAVIDAQNNIRALIEYFQHQYGIQLVALEGGKGKVDTTLFRTFRDERVKKKVMEEYLGRAEVNGAVMASIFNPDEGVYYGIENWPLYERNYLAYLRAMRQKEKILSELKTLREGLDEKRAVVYSPELNEFHEKVQAFREDQGKLMPLLEYIKRKKTGPWGRDIEAGRYPHLKTLLDSMDSKFAADGQLDQRRMAAMSKQHRAVGAVEDPVVELKDMAESFSRRFAKRMDKAQAMEFNGKFQEFVTGRMDAASFLKYLLRFAEQQKEKVELSPAMRELLGYSDTLASIKGTRLFAELEDLLNDMEEGLITKKEERLIAEEYKKILILRNLASLELTRNDLGQFKKSPEDYSRLLPNPALLTGAAEFYQLAVERDQALHRNLESLMREQKSKTAIVLAGGFHSEGFTASMKEKGYSFCVVTPRIQSLTGHERYQEVMGGNLSYKDYLMTTAYDAFAKHATLRLVSELNAPDFRKALKQWRDEIIRKLANEGRVASAGEYTRYLDFLIQQYVEKFGAKGLTDKSKEEILKDIAGELAKFRDNSLTGVWTNFEAQAEKFTDRMRGLMEKKEVTPEKIAALIRESGAVQPGQAAIGSQSKLAASLGVVTPGLPPGLIEKVILLISADRV